MKVNPTVIRIDHGRLRHLDKIMKRWPSMIFQGESRPSIKLFSIDIILYPSYWAVIFGSAQAAQMRLRGFPRYTKQAPVWVPPTRERRSSEEFWLWRCRREMASPSGFLLPPFCRWCLDPRTGEAELASSASATATSYITTAWRRRPTNSLTAFSAKTGTPPPALTRSAFPDESCSCDLFLVISCDSAVN